MIILLHGPWPSIILSCLLVNATAHSVTTAHLATTSPRQIKRNVWHVLQGPTSQTSVAQDQIAPSVSQVATPMPVLGRNVYDLHILLCAQHHHILIMQRRQEHVHLHTHFYTSPYTYTYIYMH